MKFIQLSGAPLASQYVAQDGTVFVPNADGTLDAPAAYAGQLRALSFVPVQAFGADTTANRPATGLAAGLGWFDTTLNRPIWRNAANSGWVFHDGTAA